MNATISELMPPKKQKPKSGKSPKFPSREKVKYAGIPVEYWDALEALSEEDEGQFHKRSVAYLTTLAVKEFLAKHGRLPAKPPVTPPNDE